MPIPDGYDFALAIGATGFETLLAAQLGQGTIPAQVGPLTLAMFHCTRAATGPEPRFRIAASGVMFGFTPATLNVVIEFFLGRNDGERVLEAQRHELEGLRVTDVASGATSDYPLSNAERTDIEQQLDDALASLPLINVDGLVGALARALDVDMDPATAAVALASAPEHDDYQDALMLVVSRHPNAPDVDRPPPSLLRRARHVAVGFAQDLLNDVVFPAAIDDQFGNLPATIGDADNRASLRRVSLTVEDDAFLLDADLQAGGQDINVSGPIYAYYSQPDRGLWLSMRDVKADVEIPGWVLFAMHLLGPFGIIFVFMIPVKLVADALATDVAHDRLGRALGDANLLNLGVAGRLGFGDQIALVVRYMEIVHGTLIVGAQFMIGPAQASPVGASGIQRLRWIELDNGEVLGVPDVAELIHSGILAVNEVHTVNYAPNSIHVYLRRNHDATTLNNLRELPSVDIGRLPDYEHPARWLAAFFH